VETKKTIRKKPGPIPGPATVRTNVLLEADLIEWGKQQPGGLSELVRRLLREAYEREKQKNYGEIG
jgi:hypothetical protein